MMSVQKKLHLIQCLCLLVYILIIAFAPLGSAAFDMGIVYITAPENGNSGSLSIDLTFDVLEKLVFIGMAIVEFIFFCAPKRGLNTCGALLCAIRTLPLLPPFFLALLDLLSHNETFTTDLTIFAYLAALLCVASFICHRINRRQCLPATDTQAEVG